MTSVADGPMFAAVLEITRNTVFTGLMVGLMTGLVAVGIVLVYRSSRVINFAYGEVGVFGAALLAILVINFGWNYWLALAASCLVGAAISMVIELVVVRRLFEAPRVILFAATLGLSQLVFAATLNLPDPEPGPFPSPFFVQPSRANPDAAYSLFGLDIPFEVAGIRVLGREVMVLLFVPVIVVALAWFLNRTLYGLCVRASATNPEAARLAGVSPRRMSTLVWTLAGALAVLTAALLIPLSGTPPGPQAFVIGPGLLLRALAAALIGRMVSLPLAVAGGLGIGVIESVVLFNVDSSRLLLNTPGFFMALLFALVLVLVLVQARNNAPREPSVWSFSPRVRPVPAELRDRFVLARLPMVVGVLAVIIGLVAPVIIDRPSKIEILSTALLWGLIGLSVTVLTGWAGQLSLGQFAFAGLGAMTMATVNRRGIPWGGPRLFDEGLPFVPAVIVAVAVCVVAAMIIGAPSLQVRGLFLAVTTLAFAVASSEWLFEQRIFLEAGNTSTFVPRPTWLDSQRSYYYVCFGVLVVAVLVAARLRRGGIGRSLIAVRDNERSAAAYTVSPARAKFIAFAIAGGMAGLGGALLAGLREKADPGLFGVGESLSIVSVAIVGGVASVAGPVIGALWVQGLPAVVDFSSTVNLLRSGIGLLVMLMYFPGGLVQIGYSIRDAVLRRLAENAPPDRQAPVEVPVPRADRPASSRREPPVGALALRAQGVSVHFGGRRAVDRVSIDARPGEVVGLIGGNGAGKSTLMNAIGGFVPSEGRVELLGRDVSGFSPHRRARAGLGRTFQAADLFGDLTVTETVQIALEARDRTDLAPALLGLPSNLLHERRKQRQAAELIGFIGLGRYADAFISELSTGTRRICELACLLALDARVLCLDEPTAGVAQRETEAFGPLIKRIQSELGATLVVIEHDMPLIMSISDRVYCLEAGVIIAEGDPVEVRNNPAVIASYLGTDERTIARSDL